MADKSIGELPVSQSMTDDALLVVYQSGDTQSIEGALVKKYARDAVEQYVDDAAQAAGEAKIAVGAAQTAAGEAQGAAEVAKENADKTAADVLVVQGAADAERERVAAEEGRIAQESGREIAEGERATQEGLREIAEGQRTEQEGIREAVERLRDTAEQNRVTTETARVTAEEQRATEEGKRAAAEQGRTTAEGLRNTAEGQRAEAEQTRGQNEDARVQGETTRGMAEGERAAAERLRGQNEEARELAEGARETAEEARNLWEDYDPAKGYVVGNKVTFNGSSYLCVTACTGKAPTDTAYWLLIAAKGVDGEGGGDMLAATYDPTGKQMDVFAFAQEQGEAAKTAAAQDATTKADAAKAEAISTAATDATTKANQAEANAKAASRPVAWMPSAQDVGADPVGSAGAVNSKLTTHTNDTTKHITAAERTKWNGKAGIFGPVTVSVPVGSWAGAGPWTQTVAVAGVTAADNGLTVCPSVPTDRGQTEAYSKAYGCITPPDGDVDTVAGGIKLTCYKSKPETTFQIILKGVR